MRASAPAGTLARTKAASSSGNRLLAAAIWLTEDSDAATQGEVMRVLETAVAVALVYWIVRDLRGVDGNLGEQLVTPPWCPAEPPAASPATRLFRPFIQARDSVSFCLHHLFARDISLIVLVVCAIGVTSVINWMGAPLR